MINIKSIQIIILTLVGILLVSACYIKKSYENLAHFDYTSEFYKTKDTFLTQKKYDFRRATIYYRNLNCGTFPPFPGTFEKMLALDSTIDRINKSEARAKYIECNCEIIPFKDSLDFYRTVRSCDSLETLSVIIGNFSHKYRIYLADSLNYNPDKEIDGTNYTDYDQKMWDDISDIEQQVLKHFLTSEIKDKNWMDE